MTELCLIRHGETDWNLKGLTQGATDIPLNALGREQARITGSYIRQERWDAVYSSDLSRARETATIIAAALREHPGAAASLEVALEPRLRERGFGEAEGLDVVERKSRYRDSESIPGSESWENVRLRGLAVLEELAERHRNERVLVVSHGGLIISVLSELSSGKLRPGKPALRNLSMSLVGRDEGWQVLWYNRLAPDLENEAVSA
ncbi:MAG: histidine phosphatase family protein [Spirochaetaceae bacterium]